MMLEERSSKCRIRNGEKRLSRLVLEHTKFGLVCEVGRLLGTLRIELNDIRAE